MLYQLQPLSNHGFICFSWFEEERRLDVDEKPLVVQLNWNKDDREGRFVLKNENDAVPAKVRDSEPPGLVLGRPDRGTGADAPVPRAGSSLPPPLFC